MMFAVIFTVTLLACGVVAPCPHPTMLGKHVCFANTCRNSKADAEQKSIDRNINYDRQRFQTILIG